MATRILTWNLQGRARPDLDAVAAVVGDALVDVVALQEVQRSQAREIAWMLGWSSLWRFKHWPVLVPPEGLALLSPAPLVDVGTTHLAHPFRPWSWRRRIAVRATVGSADGPFSLVATHLGAGVGDEERCRQAELVVGALGAASGPARGRCVVGDLNTHPGSPVLATFARHGLRDAWGDVQPGKAGPTNWSSPQRHGPPDQRLDYALVDDGFDVVSVELPDADEAGFGRYARLSDHLPVTVAVIARNRA